MLRIDKKTDGKNVVIALTGRLDTTAAPELDAELKDVFDAAAENLTFDFSGIDYISSAGLRVLLSAQKIMNKQGSMRLTNVSDSVKDIFEVTGFSEILTIN